MKNIKKLSISSKDVVWEIINSKRGQSHQALVDATVEINRRLDEYLALFTGGLLDSLPSTPRPLKAIKDDLLKCYSSSTIALESLLDDVRRKRTFAAKQCPYCGITKPQTIDHYYPQDEYPEFCVLQENLIPCCGNCNSKKGDIIRESGRRLFVHIIVDKIPDVQFLKVNVSERDDSIGGRFIFSSRMDLSDPNNRRIKDHYDKLELIKRYNDEISDEIDSIISSGKVFQLSSNDPVDQYFLNQSNEDKRIFGNNYWRGVLMHKISKLPNIEEIVKNAKESE